MFRRLEYGRVSGGPLLLSLSFSWEADMDTTYHSFLVGCSLKL